MLCADHCLHEDAPADRTAHMLRTPLTGGHLQLIPNLCTEGHRRQVWLYVMILSVLCRSTCANNVPETKDLQICVNNLKHAIEKSDAMLYAPSLDDIEDNCDTISLHCYMLELVMVLIEEEVQDKQDDTNCIFAYIEDLKNSTGANTGNCLPCEAMPLKNITIFLENLKSLLNKLTAESG